MGTHRFGPVEMDDSFIYTFFPLLGLIFLILYFKSSERTKSLGQDAVMNSHKIPGPDAKLSQSQTIPEFLQEPITPIEELDILSQPPYPFRPYKPIYHMTMGLKKCAPNELFLLDSSYPTRIALRKTLVAQNPSTMLGASPQAGSAVKELYHFILSQHLPTRFPSLFAIDAAKSTFTNRVSNDTHPLTAPEPSTAALSIIASTVEEDILILQQDPAEDAYRLTAFIACFPNGFDSSQKMGMTLREIHRPVPLFREKLAPSMDRFFGKLEVGRWVKRLNWTVSTHEKLSLPIGNHIYDGDSVPQALDTVDLDRTYLRVERQVLLRLPKSKAMAFFVKTYMTPLTQIKAEGEGDALATAIEGMPEKLGIYKRRVVWGRAVIDALRA
ncbi:hypothetical protein ABW21_db0200678 [Orbilia brochopaga]|nr:hypothetical protein ABW21_db0200678 [Drechslerella brochopaga]